jgi:radical SAM protein with 4Fe4S-binding SPASM domain
MVSPCRLLIDHQNYLGNILESGFSAILKLGHRKFDSIGVDKVSCGCAECPVRYFCVGGCKAMAYYASGTLDNFPPNCGLLKKIYIESLWSSINGPSHASLNNLMD